MVLHLQHHGIETAPYKVWGAGGGEMKHILIKTLSSSYAKIFIGGLVAFSAVICGVYVGSAITGSSADKPRSATDGIYTREGQHIQMPEEYYPTFDSGDLFPTADYKLVDGSIGNFDGLLKGKRSIMLFVHFGCEACNNLLYDWHTWSGLNTRRDIQVLICIGQSPDEVAPSTWDNLADYGAVFVDRRFFKDNFNLSVWPTIVCVDQFGLVTALQVGYKDVFSEDIARCLR